MTASKRRMAAWNACWEGQPPISRCPPAFSRRPGWWALSATISPPKTPPSWPSHGIDLEGLERVPGKTFFWAGKYSHDMNDRETLVTDLNVFADFNPKLPESYRSQPYLLLGNIQPALQRSVPQQMSTPASGRRRHHELLDQGFSGRAARDHPRLGFPADQRRRGAHAFRRIQPAQSRRGDSRAWVRIRW